MKRALLGLVGLVVLAAVGAVVALTLLDDGPDAPDRGRPADEEPDTAGDERIELGATGISDTEARRRQLRKPWPFASFESDISRARRPTRHAVFLRRHREEIANFDIVEEHRITLQMDEFRLPELIDRVAPGFAEAGLRVYTQDPPLPDQIVFRNLNVTNATIQDVIRWLDESSEGMVAYVMTPTGLCIGSRKAVYQASLNAKEWEREAREEVAEDLGDDTFLDVEYRPDFQDAHIGNVIDDILTKTGVEVVTDQQVWSAPVALSWRTEPLPLRVALRGIAQQLGATLQALDGRAFLLGP